MQSAGPDFNYPLVVARRAGEGEPEWIAGALIGESDGGAVIAAFPGAAWNRQAGRRRPPIPEVLPGCCGGARESRGES